MFNNKRRLASAWAKGLMLGKAVGARDERDRILAIIKQYDFADVTNEIIAAIKAGKND